MHANTPVTHVSLLIHLLASPACLLMSTTICIFTITTATSSVPLDGMQDLIMCAYSVILDVSPALGMLPLVLHVVLPVCTLTSTRATVILVVRTVRIRLVAYVLIAVQHVPLVKEPPLTAPLVTQTCWPMPITQMEYVLPPVLLAMLVSTTSARNVLPPVSPASSTRTHALIALLAISSGTTV